MTIVRDVLESWLTATNGRWQVPIQPMEVSKSLGVTLLVESEGGSVCGSDLVTRDGSMLDAVARSQPKDGLFIPAPSPTIFLAAANKKTDSLSVRQRFTWAHELAHYILWRSMGTATPGAYWAVERECNRFASMFLVPEKTLLAIVGKPSKAWLGLIPQISNACKVSWPVAAGRMTMFSDGKVVFIKGRLVKPAGQYWQIEVHYSSAVSVAGTYRGSRAIIKDFLFIERCKSIAEGDLLVTKVSSDIGSLPTKGCSALVRRYGNSVEAMFRLKSQHSLQSG